MISLPVKLEAAEAATACASVLSSMSKSLLSDRSLVKALTASSSAVFCA